MPVQDLPRPPAVDDAVHENEARQARWLAFDELMIDVLTRFATCPAHVVEAAVTDAIQGITRLFGAHHGYLLTFAADGTSIVSAFEFCEPGVAPQRDAFVGAELDIFPWQLATLRAGRVVRFDTLDEFPPDALVERAVSVLEGGVNNLIVPVRGADGRLNGCLGVHHHANPRPWRDDDVTQLTMLGNAVGGALERRAAEADLARRAAFDEMVSGALVRLATCGDEALDATVEEVLGTIATFIGADHAFVLALDDEITFSMAHEWCAPGVSKRFDQYQRVPLDSRPWQVARLRAGEMIVIARADEHEDREFYASEGTRAVLTTPTSGPEERVTGAVGFHRHSAPGPWPSRDFAAIRGFANAMTGVVGRRRAEAARRETEARNRLLGDQLQQAQKMEAVGRLAGGVAHDFNNLLSVILGNAELACQQLAADDPARAEVDEIIAAARRSADLTGQLLAFARRQPSRRTTLDLNDVIEQLLKMLRRLIGEDIAIDWHPTAGLWPVHADASHVDQVLVNLAANARDAVAGVGRVRIETRNVTVEPALAAAGEAAGDYVALSVSDTGTGMSPEVVAHAFEPFFTTKEPGKGTGLGLATVYGIVRQHEGFVRIATEAGQGTTVTVCLPRAADSPLRDQGRAPAIHSAIGGETILLVEDADPVRNLGIRALSRLGYTVLSAATPAEALGLADAHRGPIHLLLTDVVLPEMNGQELARLVRERHPATRCLLMSGYPADATEQQGEVGPGYLFLQKPFSLGTLSARVREALDAAS